MTSKATSGLQSRRTSRPSTPALIELPAPPTSFWTTSLLAPEERPLGGESFDTMRTPVPISSPTPKALATFRNAIDSGYETKLRDPPRDYFSIEHPGTKGIAEGQAPLASPQPLHTKPGTPSLIAKVTLAAEQDTLTNVGHWIPRAVATDSSLVMTRAQLVAGWIPRAATDSLLVLSHPKLVPDDSVWDAGEPQTGTETVKSDTSEESEASFRCRTSAAIERLTAARVILRGDLKHAGDSLLDRRMSM